MLQLTILFRSRLDILPGGYPKSETNKQFSKPWGQFKNQSLQCLMGQKSKVLKPCIHKQCEAESSNWHSAILIARSISDFYSKPAPCTIDINWYPHPLLTSLRVGGGNRHGEVDKGSEMSLLEEGREEDEKAQGQSHGKELGRWRALPQDQPTG